MPQALALPAPTLAADPLPQPALAVGGWRQAALMVAACTALALVLAGSYYRMAVTAGSLPTLPPGKATALGLLQGYIVLPATFAAFALTARFPLEPGQRLRHGAMLVLSAVGVVALKLALYYYPGQALGVIRPEMSYVLALHAYGGQCLLTYVLLVGVAHAVRYGRTMRERELARSQLQTQLMQAQLQMLKMQLHPHFLFNTLHAISTLVHVDPDRAERMIASLSEMLRTTLAQARAQEVSLCEELATLEPYLDIEKTRLGERLAVVIRAEPDTLDARVPHLLLQPLVENAIRHGISPRRRPGRVEIRAARSGGRLLLEVADNGAGISGTPRPDAIGLANTRARLAQLYGQAQRLEIESAPERGTRIRIRIPFHTAPRAEAPSRS